MPNYRRLYVPGGTVSRRKQRESDVWQRRFLEHTIKDEQDRFRWAVPTLRDYNAVKHRYVTCPRVAVFKLRKVDCSGGIHAEMGVRVRRCDMAAARLESDRGVRGGVRRFPWAVSTLLTGEGLAMARIWKEPYSVERDIECTGHWGHPGNLVTVRPRPNSDWIYFVEVCRFTFVFFSPAEIVPYLDFYRTKGRGGRATLDPQGQYYSRWGGGPRNEHDEWQSPFERLPLRLRKEPKRQKVVKALEEAQQVFAGDQKNTKKSDVR